MVGLLQLLLQHFVFIPLELDLVLKTEQLFLQFGVEFELVLEFLLAKCDLLLLIFVFLDEFLIELVILANIEELEVFMEVLVFIDL